MTEPVLSLRDVSLTLKGNAGPVNILKNISLDVEAGTRISLVGPSGSGKSSLLMVMGGLERATGGQVMAMGQDFSAMNEDQLARFRRAHMGVVFQSFHLIPTMTALENVAVPLELAGVNDAFDLAAKELELVGLAHRMDHYPAQLSGGEQQRVALARALAPQPSILFGDEPTGNLDGKTGHAVIDLIFDLSRERQSTLVLVTHDPALADRCDRVISMSDGRIVDDTGDTQSVDGSKDIISKVAGK